MSPHVELDVLGPLEVRVDGRPTPVPGPRQRAVLTALLLRYGRVVGIDRLVDDVFGDDPPHAARNAVQTYVARLRHALGTASDAVETRTPGYVLHVAREAIDAERFAELCAASQSAPPAEAVAILDEALDLWHGPAYAEFADSFARGAAQRYEDLLLSARERRAGLLLDLGRHAEAVTSLEALVTEAPWRERTVELLIIGLARQGRKADALAAYRDYRRRLREDLDLDPAPRIDRLRDDVLHDRLAPTATPPARRRWIPTRPTSFVGRDREKAEVSALLEPGRLVTLVGPGGVGKTRLASEIATGVATAWWVDLAAVSEASALPRTLIDAVGLDVQPGAGHREALRGWLRSADGLLVLDNCEHILVATARLLHDLLAQPSGVRLLATSRERLDLDNEYVVPVAPLPVTDHGEASGPVVQLFLDRARAALPGFAPDPAALSRIAEICRALDGLPLAIELAAARVGTLTIDDLTQRLGARFELLRRAPGFAGQRHGTLTGALDVSYDLLTAHERMLFLRLSVFAADVDIATAEAVVADDDLPAGRVADLLARLADRSMLTRPGPTGVGWYRMLETLRHYASSMLSPDAAERLRGRHANHFAELTERAENGLRGSNERAWVCTVESWLDDVRAAWQWARDAGEHDIAVRIAAALTWFGYWRLRPDVVDLGAASVSVAESGAHPLLPVCYASAAHAAWFDGRIDEARDLACRGIAAAGGDRAPAAAAALNALGDIELLSGHPDLAATAYRGFAAVSEAGQDPTGLALGRANTALCAAYSGSPRARELAAAAVATARDAQNPTVTAFALFCQGEAIADDEPERAAHALSEAERIAQAVRNPLARGVAMTAAVALAGRHGQPDAALALFRDAVAHWRASWNRTLVVTTLRNLVILLARTGHDEQAVGLAATLRQSAHAPPYGVEAGRMERALSAARRRLGDDGYAHVWKASENRSIEDAAADAERLLRDIS